MGVRLWAKAVRSLCSRIARPRKGLDRRAHVESRTASAHCFSGGGERGDYDIFRKLSSNPTLITELRKFKDERNFLSHKGIAHCLDPDGEIDYVTASEFQSRLAAIAPEAERLRLAVHEEANKFRGYLWFDDESNVD